MLGDLQLAARLLLKTPIYTATAVLILAVAIAGNTAAFSAANVLLLEPLPFRDPDRLVILASADRTTGTRAGVSWPDFEDWTAEATAFEGSGAVELEQAFNVSGVVEPVQVTGGRMTSTVLPLLGVRPVRGRPILPTDEKAGAAAVVLITDRYWETAFRRDESAVGRDLIVDGRYATIVGVLPPDFRLLYGGYSLWAPLRTDETRTDRAHRSLVGIARLQAGTTPSRAAAALTSVTSRLEREYPATNGGRRARVLPLRDFVLAGRGHTLVFVLAALGFLLLVACANVASLQLARGSARRGEIAVRLALGASRRRIVRMLLVESGVVAAVGGGLALLIVAVARRILLASSPDLRELTISLPVLAFTLAVTGLTAIAFGLLPALTATRMQLAAAVRGNVAAQRSTRRLRSALVVAELCVSLVLLVPAGLLLKSFLTLRQMEPGFRVDNVLTFSVALPAATYSDRGRQGTFAAEAVARLATIPGVTSVAATDALPLDQAPSVELHVPGHHDGRGPAAENVVRATIRSVTPGYFRTLDIPMRAGRTFNERDVAAAPGVAIVNETLAAAIRADRDVIGTRVDVGHAEALTIIGVVGDVRSLGLRTPPQAEVLVAFDQHPSGRMAVALATVGVPTQYVAAVRDRMRALDRDLPLAYVRAMEEIVQEQTAALRAVAAVLATLAALALLLATAGLSGIMSWLVTQRTHELGVRTALGATRRDVLMLIVRDAVVLVGSGVALGIPLAGLVARLLPSVLWGVGAMDLVIFIAVTATIVLTAAAAGFGPARRATRVDPLAALRAE